MESQRKTPVGEATRILLTSTSYPADPGDWQGLFIQRMLEGLSRRQDLTIEAWCPPGTLPERVTSALREDDGAWFCQLASRGGVAHLLRKHPPRGLVTSGQLIRRLRRACHTSRPDVYHVNWLQCVLGLPSNTTPALVTVLGTDIQLLRLPFVRRLLAHQFSRRRTVLCPNADWMIPILESSFAPDVSVRCVPFGIDDTWFGVKRRPVDHDPARWLCVTRVTQGKIGHLLDWAAPWFQGPERELHLIGPHQDPSLKLPEWVHYHGSMTPAQLRQDWFPGATGLVSLSTHPEGRPQVMLEAMAAGLPILASSNRAHVDLVEHRRTGWICADPGSFAEGLRFVEDAKYNFALGQQAKVEARRRFGDWDDCAARYAALYGWLCE